MPEGDGTVLDNSCLLFISSMWSGSKHDASKLPIILAGGLGGTLQTGRVLDYHDQGDDNRKLCSMYLSIMDRMGVQARPLRRRRNPTQRFLSREERVTAMASADVMKSCSYVECPFIPLQRVSQISLRLLFPPLRRGGQGGWSRHDRSPDLVKRGMDRLVGMRTNRGPKSSRSWPRLMLPPPLTPPSQGGDEDGQEGEKKARRCPLVGTTKRLRASPHPRPV